MCDVLAVPGNYTGRLGVFLSLSRVQEFVCVLLAVARSADRGLQMVQCQRGACVRVCTDASGYRLADEPSVYIHMLCALVY